MKCKIIFYIREGNIFSRHDNFFKKYIKTTNTHLSTNNNHNKESDSTITSYTNKENKNINKQIDKEEILNEFNIFNQLKRNPLYKKCEKNNPKHNANMALNKVSSDSFFPSQQYINKQNSKKNIVSDHKNVLLASYKKKVVYSGNLYTSDMMESI